MELYVAEMTRAVMFDNFLCIIITVLIVHRILKGLE